ncbi:UDP-glucose 4-epimerase [Candidatus Entotheonellaceae bacterium PAL068K]
MATHVLVTGGAGFIGSHLCARLCTAGQQVTCLDSFDAFYAPSIKHHNVQRLLDDPKIAARLTVHHGDIRDRGCLESLLRRQPFDLVIHLAARVGVRPSVEQPLLYNEVNVQGTLTLLECCRAFHVRQFLFGSSSSVYGARTQGPFAEADDVSTPVSPYAATKRAAELLCYTYFHLHRMRIACLRFFTVYGPCQRPDLAIHKFARLMAAGKPLPVYGDGTSQRDYTYIDDIVDGILRAGAWLQREASDDGCYEIFNLGGFRPVPLSELIRRLETALGYPATIESQPAQPGDVPITRADPRKSHAILGYHPHVDLTTGLQCFAAWFHQQNS